MLADSLEVKITADDTTLTKSLAKIDKQLAGIDSSGDKVFKNFKTRFDDLLPSLMKGSLKSVGRDLDKWIGEVLRIISSGLSGISSVRGGIATPMMSAQSGVLGGVLNSFASNQGATQMLEKIFKGVIAGARANGGPVSGGKSYLVGERGPELFTPANSGVITPGGAGGVYINMIINTPDASSFRASHGQITAELAQSLRKAARNN